MSGLRTEAVGGQMASERLACRGLAERLTSGLRFQWEDETGHRKSWRWGGGARFRTQGPAGAKAWRLEGPRDQRAGQVA